MYQHSTLKQVGAQRPLPKPKDSVSKLFAAADASAWPSQGVPGRPGAGWNYGDTPEFTFFGLSIPLADVANSVLEGASP
jgi:hypothetical protein